MGHFEVGFNCHVKAMLRKNEKRKTLRLVDLLGVFVVHDGEELIDRQHLGQRLGVEQLLGSLQGDDVGQSPVGVVGHHQVAHVVHRLLLSRVHLLPAQISAAVRQNNETKKRSKRTKAPRDEKRP